MALTYIRDVSGNEPWQGPGQVAKLYHEPAEDWHVVVTAIPSTDEAPAEAGAFKVDENGEASFETFILPPVMLPDEQVTGDLEADIAACVVHFDQLTAELPEPGSEDDFLQQLAALFDGFEDESPF